MLNPLSRRLFAVGLCCAATAASGRSPQKCEVCGRRLPERYWTFENKVCCSQNCVDQLRPKCDGCGGTIRGKYLEAEGKIYCSNACYEKTLQECEICKNPIHSGFIVGKHHYCSDCSNNNPTCFSCGLPSSHPTRLNDGRNICHTCMRWAVKTQAQAQKHYDRSLRILEAWTRLKISSVPELKLVDRAAMMEHAGSIRKTDAPVSIRGLYSRQTYEVKRGLFGIWKTDPDQTAETIYIVDHLHDEVFRVAALHELMHDLIHEHFQRLENAPLWVHEGICQQAAAEYCRRRNYADPLAGIESCTDPDYGDGYRYINSITGFEGWNALKRWMDSVDVNTLPKTAPNV